MGVLPGVPGYNDGLSGAAGGDDAAPRKLSRETAQSADFSEGETAAVDEARFREGLDRIGVEMLEQGVQVPPPSPPPLLWHVSTCRCGLCTATEDK